MSIMQGAAGGPGGRGIVLLLGLTMPAIVIWGLTFIAMHYGLAVVGPFTFAALRFAVASLPLLPFVRRPRVPFGFLAAFGFFFGFGQFAMLIFALHLGLPTGIASLLMQLQAVLTPVMSAAVLRARISGPTILALALSLVGLGLILNAAGHGPIGVVPFFLGVTASTSWAISNVMIRIGVARGYSYDSISLIVWASLLMPIPFAVLAALAGEITAESLRAIPAALPTALYLGLFGTVAAHTLWVRAMSVFDSATVAPFSLLIPVIGLSAGYLILGETLTRGEAAGCLLVILGVVVHVLGTIVRQRRG